MISTSRLTNAARRAKLSANKHAKYSFSQEGEDLILQRLTERVLRGTYLDLGCHHPYRFSNTALLHMRGWSGINVDANPWSISAFNKARPTDTNVLAGISDSAGTLRYHQFTDGAFNTFDPEVARVHVSRNGAVLRDIRDVDTMTPKDLVDSYPQLRQEIDVLTIDIEGLDFVVLRGVIDAGIRAKIICIEETGADMLSSPVSTYLADRGYVVCGATANSRIYSRASLE